jgi:hypothetical protein
MVLLNQIVDCGAVRSERRQSGLFVVPHQTAIAVHIGAEYGGKLAFHTSLSAESNPRSSNKAKPQKPLIVRANISLR